jgi:hypothetical protein
MANGSENEEFKPQGRSTTSVASGSEKLSRAAAKAGGAALKDFLWRLDPDAQPLGLGLCELAAERVYRAIVQEIGLHYTEQHHREVSKISEQ